MTTVRSSAPASVPALSAPPGGRGLLTGGSCRDDESAYRVAAAADALARQKKRREERRRQGQAAHANKRKKTSSSNKFTSSGKPKKKPDRSLSELDCTSLVAMRKFFFQSKTVRRKLFLLTSLLAWFVAIARFASDGSSYSSASTPDGFSDEVTDFERMTIVAPVSHAPLYRGSAARGGGGVVETFEEVEARRNAMWEHSAGYLPYLKRYQERRAEEGEAMERESLPPHPDPSGIAAANDVPRPPPDEGEADRTRPLKVLAMGGSTTYGSKLDNPSSAYPTALAEKFLPEGSVAVNAAMRATGSDYAGMCVQTMVTEAERRWSSESGAGRGGGAALRIGSRGDGQDVWDTAGEGLDYDVIILEFSLNGLDGFDRLARRLMRRYPVLVYIHLWSLRVTVQDADTEEKPLALTHTAGINHREAEVRMAEMLSDPTRRWEWDPGSLRDHDERREPIAERVADAGGVLYELPLDERAGPDGPLRGGWFGGDYHHLSEKGHVVVAEGVSDLLDSIWKAERENSADGTRRAELRGSWGVRHLHYFCRRTFI